MTPLLKVAEREVESWACGVRLILLLLAISSDLQCLSRNHAFNMAYDCKWNVHVGSDLDLDHKWENNI